jgi:PAS domain-containing protein
LLFKNLKIKIYRNIILPVVLYGCDTWSLTVRDERRLIVFENRVLRRIFGPTRDEVLGEWRKLHNKELNDLSSSPNVVRRMKSRKMRWAEHVERMGERRGIYRVLVGKPERKRLLGRPRCRWDNTIKMVLQEVGYGGMDWIELAQDRDRRRCLRMR